MTEPVWTVEVAIRRYERITVTVPAGTAPQACHEGIRIARAEEDGWELGPRIGPAFVRGLCKGDVDQIEPGEDEVVPVGWTEADRSGGRGR